MATATITGPITSIVYDAVDPVNWSVISLSTGEGGSGGGPPVDPPTEIVPSGKPITIILATATGPSNVASSGLTMSSSFNVGDVVEIYCQAGTQGRNDVGPIVDENGNTIAGVSGLGNGAILRKLTSGSGQTWGLIKSA